MAKPPLVLVQLSHTLATIVNAAALVHRPQQSRHVAGDGLLPIATNRLASDRSY
jgi:hypothetical protein